MGESLPSDMISLLDEGLEKARIVEKAVEENSEHLQTRIPEAFLSLEKVRLLAPIPLIRKNIVCLGLNYSDHAAEASLPLPEKPIFFTKPATSIIDPDDEVILPRCSREVDFEVELAFVFGKRGKNISEEEAFDYVAGYTILNDVTARDLQRSHLQWFKGKSLDTFAPIGPYIVTKDEVSDPHNLELTMKVNGITMQKSNTKNMYFKIPTLVEDFSMDMTVEPGEVIATGTPAGVGFT